MTKTAKEFTEIIYRRFRQNCGYPPPFSHEDWSDAVEGFEALITDRDAELLADREERIRVLEWRVEAALSEPPNPAQWVPRSELRNLQARIDRVKGLVCQCEAPYYGARSIGPAMCERCGKLADQELLAALDGEPPSTATIVHAGPLKMKPIEPEPKKGGVDGR